VRDTFKWDRTTENFFRYVSQRTFLERASSSPLDRERLENRHYVVYIPRHGRDNPPYLEEEFIVSRMTPDTLGHKPYGEPVAEAMPPGTYEAQIKDVRKLGDREIAVTFKAAPIPFDSRRAEEKVLRHALNYSDPNMVPFRDLRGNNIFTGRTLEERVANLEWLMGLAYQALEKLIGWYYKAKRRRQPR
jgi:hypothetical protein